MTRFLRREDGIAMPVAMSVLALCLVLTALVASSADSLSRTSGQDQRAKRALAAAEAGIGVAVRRLRSLPYLPASQCLTTVGVGPGTGGAAPGECPGASEALGGGASFTYHVTPALTAPGGCYQVPGQTIPATWTRRCVTATGSVNGVTRRVQRQVIAPPQSQRQWRGIIGLDHVEIRNSAKLSACHATDTLGPAIGSNLSVTVDNSSVLNHGCPAKVWGIEMPAGRSPSIHPQAQPAGAIPVTTAPGPYTIPGPPRSFEDVETTNDNARVSGYTGSGIVWYPQPETRGLGLTNGGRITFTQGGDYAFCTLALDNSSSIDFAPGQLTRIFIDSPSRPGSSCTSGYGFVPVNGSRVNWPSTVADTDVAALSARAKNLEIYVWGNDVLVDNGVRIAGLLQAERNQVHFVNSSLTWGAVAAKRVIVENSGNFNRPDGLHGRDGYGPEFRSAGWGQCRSVAPVPTDPESGCV